MSIKIKYISLLTAISILLLQMPVFASNGNGTAESPYLVRTAEDLQKISDNLSAHYMLANDIDLSGIGFEPIGNEADGAFKGTFDGNGYTINNLTIEKEGYKYIGFIGCLEGTIKNINFNNAKIDGQSSRYVGNAVGYVCENAVIDNCKVLSGNVTGSYIMMDFSLGGIAGYSNGAISNSHNNAKVECIDEHDNTYTGGIVGYNDGNINECTNNGSITATFKVGGISGYNEKYISRCVNNGTVLSTLNCSYNNQGDNNDIYLYSGGIAGCNNQNISNCTNNGLVLSSLVYSFYKYAYNDHVHGIACSGGISGLNTNEIRLCLNTGTISSNSNTTHTGANCYSTSKSLAGGIAGICGKLGYYGSIETHGKIYDCINNGNIKPVVDRKKTTGNYCNAYGGGITGEGGYIYNCNNISDVILYSTGNSCGGGIIGLNSGNAYNCINNGNITHMGTSTATNTTSYYIAAYSYNIYIKEDQINISQNTTAPIPIEKYGYEKDLKWTSADESVAIVDSKGNVTGVGAGATVITAETELGITTSTTVNVSGYTAPTELVSLNKTSEKLELSDTLQLSAEVKPSDSNAPITWSSSNSDIATVDDTGLVTAVGIGTSVISARIGGGRTLYCVVKVVSDTENIEVQSVQINNKEITLAPNDAVPMNAIVFPADATDAQITYSSDNEEVATVNSQGIVVGKAAGVAIISAETSNGCKDECIVKVISADSPSIILSAEKAEAGATSEVKASIVKNPGISAYKFVVKYDKELLTPVDIVSNPDMKGTFSTNINDDSREELQILWYSDIDVDINADLFTIKFDVSQENADGDKLPIDVSCSANDICNINGDKFALDIRNAFIEIAEPVFGDVYEDGDVNIYDLTLMSRYITNLEEFTARQVRNGDINNDGTVDIKDVVKLAQHILGNHNAKLMSMNDANESTTINIDSAMASSDGEAYIPVRINNNAGIAGFRFEVNYNSDEIEIIDIIPSESVSGDTFRSNVGNGDSLVVSWYQTNNLTDDCDLFIIHAKYKENVDKNKSEISITNYENNICNSDIASVNVEYSDGGIIRFSEQPYKINDITIGLDSASVSITNYNGTGAKLILATYDECDTLLECKTQSVTIDKGNTENVEIVLDTNNATYIKAFLWNDIDNMKPMSDSFKKNI